MKDYYATLRIQQGRLKAAMRDLGIETVSELSRRSGVCNTIIGSLLNFRISPRAKNGEWRESTLLICKALGSEPSDLFPDHLDHEIQTNRISAFVEHAQLSGGDNLQLLPGDELQRAEMEQTVDEVLGGLKERERRVLKARFWEGKTLDDVGREFGNTGTTIRMIEARALNRLRHPERLAKLASVCTW
jgi:RNA polymerase sigma factor (sigma-70 family)